MPHRAINIKRSVAPGAATPRTAALCWTGAILKHPMPLCDSTFGSRSYATRPIRDRSRGPRVRASIRRGIKHQERAKITPSARACQLPIKVLFAKTVFRLAGRAVIEDAQEVLLATATRGLSPADNVVNPVKLETGNHWGEKRLSDFPLPPSDLLYHLWATVKPI
jgi:hypothetical protein